MSNLRLKSFIWVTVVVSALAVIVIQWIASYDLRTVGGILKLLPKVVMIDTFFFLWLSKWGWKYPIFKGWLVPFPDLNGTWKGHLKSNWVDPKTNKKPDPIPTVLAIRQSFFRISCVQFTGESRSGSYVADFVLDPESQTKKLVYSYMNKPKAQVVHRSKPHEGTTSFEIIEQDGRKLVGHYWSSRETTGDIELSFWKDQIVDHLPSDLDAHPMSEQDAGSEKSIDGKGDQEDG